MKYKIKQLKDLRNCEYSFDGWKYAKDKFNLEDYEVVYEGNIEPKDPSSEYTNINVLENLFYVFNMQRPDDFKGHSLSVSDVVELDGVNYYCDSAGWVKL